MQWHQNTDGDSYVLLLPNRESVVITQDLLGQIHIVGTVNGSTLRDKADSLPEAFRTADNFVTTFGRDIVHLLKRESKWHADPATDKQIALLRRLRVPILPGISKGDAAKKINEAFAKGAQYRKAS
jgi:hypothetical protein